MDIISFFIVSGLASMLVTVVVSMITKYTGLHGKPAYALVALIAFGVVSIINFFSPDLQETIQSLWGTSGFIAVGIYEFILKDKNDR